MINLDKLNKQQKEAVTSDDKYIRVIAGAGSGKTRVLVTRIAYLIDNKLTYPNKILAITFTNKAANEMKKRISLILDDASVSTWISTIHSFCVRVLREDILSLGYPRNFTIMDDTDQKQILKEAYKELSVDSQYISYSSALDYISNNKVAGISYDRAIDFAKGFYGEEIKAKLYKYYCIRQESMYALDFDDLLLYVLRLFKSFSEILEKWQNRFSHILVDEFQDIDNVQYEIIKLLCGSYNSLYVVGDPDQTIYTWRGANVNIIMDFDKDFKGCKTVILNENYRSGKYILNGANSLIKNNKYRVEKDLFTNSSNDEKIGYYSAVSEEFEAKWIANKIKEGLKDNKKYSDFAILYRSNYLSRSIEKTLVEERIPYVIYGGIKFYDRAEIKDMLAYLRLVISGDDLAFYRVVNKPKRGIGNKTIETIREHSSKLNISMYEYSKDNDVNSKIKSFIDMIEDFKVKVNEMDIEKFFQYVLDKTGYRSELEKDHEIERLENVKELINDIREFLNSNIDAGLDEYLQVVSLYGDKDNPLNTDNVSLMTIHSSKGLEFDTVFVCGMSEGVFPSERSVEEGRQGVEEERRIAYVAFTRAKNKLYLTNSNGFSYILNKAKVKSRFVEEIDSEYLDDLNARPIKAVSMSESNRVDSIYVKGDKVEHKLFGEGIVIKVENGFVTIAFKYPYGVKTLLSSHPSFRKIKNLS